jgi:hypothetical protein
MTLAPDIQTALAAFAAEYGIVRDEAVSRILRDWLIGSGYLKADKDKSGGHDGFAI